MAAMGSIARCTLGWPLAAATLLTACAQLSPFGCDDDAQCDTGAGGRCWEPGFCAFPDAECGAGYRYDASAAAGLAKQCAPGQDLASTGTDPTSSETAASTVGPGTTDGSTGPATAGSSEGSVGTTGPSTTDDSGTTGNPCGEGPCPCTEAVSAGQTHTCAIRSDASLVCWGSNQYGKLGGGTEEPLFDDQPTPIAAVGVHFAGLSANLQHTCAVTDAGAVWCWGRNNLDQASPAGGSPNIVAAADLGIVLDAQQVSAALQSTCAENGAGTLTCWGANGVGQLAMMGPAPGPLTSGPHGDGSPVLGISGGQQHACLATADEVLCWGSNSSGQNGSGMGGGNRFTPTAVSLNVGAGVVSVAAGRYHTCAATDGGNAVWCWGRNSCGQVGAGGGTACNDATPAVYNPVQPFANLPGTVVQLSASYDHTCALMADGSAYCWGSRDGFWLGCDTGFNNVVWPPSPMSVLGEIDEKIVELAVGQQHACGRADNGRLWCWGSDQYQQLGLNDPPDGKRAVEMDLLCP